MKLSEAIRLGALLHPQYVGNWARTRDRQGRFCHRSTLGATVDATCALGAAREAGWKNFEEARDAASYTCPVCNKTADRWGVRRSLFGMLPHLNDTHRWTREAIADWVESVERSLEDAAVGREDKRVASEIEVPVRA